MQGISITKSSAETIDLGAKLASSFNGSELVLLRGDLGAGKTQFTKGIARALGSTETVTSPTFTIEKIYPGKLLTLHHFDLYRIKEDKEIEAQMQELLSSPVDVTVVEWPQNMAALGRASHYLVDIEYIDDDSRKISISKVGDTWS